MASHGIGGTGLSDSGPSNHHLSYAAALHGINTSTNFMNQEGSAFDFGELEEAIVLQGVKIRNDEAKAPLFTVTGRPAATLEMFPSWPMRFQHTPRGSSKSGGESTDSGSAVNTLSSKADAQLEPESPISKKASSDHQGFDQKHLQLQQQQQQLEMASDTSRTGGGGPSELNPSPAKTPQEKRKGSTSEKQLDAKTLRRLAQNREAARKSRLRKKAYVQQLESSRIKLTQLEQDLQRARQQGLFLGGCGGAGGNLSSGAAIFDMEYARWLEEDHRHMSDLRTGLQAHLSDGDLRMLMTQLDPLTEQQFMGIYSLQQSSQQAEEALSQGLEQLQQSLVDTIASGPVVDGMQQMAVALGKLANLEGFVRQADNLRQQTLHQLRRILTVRQGARCFLVIGEYYGRLRALSSLWASRPRESMMGDDNSCQITTDLQMVQQSQNHFTNF
ncbi:DNA binding protein, putative [Ricinus communis]|uniref:DNA binding protein, putative n=1 Tax=Ricinus communis TaxID=3988 RepID=B9SCS7_RICCO|nr:DNA binding protein, putative [Ricinus communis]